jgi:hypothetical protein
VAQRVRGKAVNRRLNGGGRHQAGW